MSTLSLIYKAAFVALSIACSVAKAETCDSATRQLNALEKTWSNKSQDPEQNLKDGDLAIDEMLRMYSVFDKISVNDACRPSFFRAMVRSGAALAPFDMEGSIETGLETRLHKNPELDSVFKSTIQDYINQNSSRPRVSCRAQMVFENVKAQKCNRTQKENCFNQGPDLTSCKDKASQ